MFTASLVVLGRILWAQHAEGAAADEPALVICESLIGQVETIFQRLDHDNSLVFSCARYINNMLEVCTAQSTQYQSPILCMRGQTLTILADTTVAVQNDGQDSSSSMSGPRFDHQARIASAPNPLETMMHLGIGDMEMFHLYSSEIYDPELFEGLDRSSAESATARNIEWENSTRAM